MTATPEPAQVEAEGIETMSIEWRGLTLVVPASSDSWDAEIFERVEENKMVSAFKLLFGPEAYDDVKRQFKQSTGDILRKRDFDDLIVTVFNAYGLDLGE